MTSMVCDLCNDRIVEDEGYAFYSSVQMAGMTIGNMLLCDRCTRKIMTPDMLAKPFAPLAIHARMTDAAMMEAVRTANVAGIAERCRAQGLTPEEAKSKARELAKQTWKDPTSGARAIEAFWTSSRQARPAVTPTSSSRQNIARRSWWRFWK